MFPKNLCKSIVGLSTRIAYINLNNERKTLLNITSVVQQLQNRNKYTQNKGIKGIRNRKHQYEVKEEQQQQENITEEATLLKIEDSEYDLVANGAMRVSRKLTQPQNVLIVQPYIKWGAKRPIHGITPEDQLHEAESLIRSLPNWQVALSLKVPLETMERKALFGKGKTEELKQLVLELRQAKGHQQQALTCLFVSKGSLSFAQKSILESTFNLPVMDRYSVVIQILRLHATSAEARLQVAMAELPYIWSQAKDANFSKSTKLGYSLNDIQREILKTRERKLKTELERIRAHRKLLRSKRKQNNYPVVAVVGYTNAGKTSLIKALTQEQSMQPRDQLFATLDVTAHAGHLPCNLEVIYMDTVGFMSDLPTGLIECFVATLEDAMLADVIVHVQDLSHRCSAQQKEHVEQTLKTLSQNISRENGGDSSGGRNEQEHAFQMPPIINVGNKIDLIAEEQQATECQENVLKVSSKNLKGLDVLLAEIEKQIMNATGRKTICIRIPNGGPEMAWLYKNTAVVNTSVDELDSQQMLMDVVVTDRVLEQFKRKFCR